MPPTITFFVVLTEVVKEKEERLRLALRMMGMRTLVFWLSWLLYGAAFVSLSTLVLMGAGWAAGMDFFTNSDPAVVFVLFLSFGVSMVMLAFLLSTLISSQKTAQTVGYSFILCGFVLQTIICSAYGGLIDLLFMPDVAPWVRWVKWLLQFYPPFNFSKAYYDGASVAHDFTVLPCSIDAHAQDRRRGGGGGQGMRWHVQRRRAAPAGCAAVRLCGSLVCCAVRTEPVRCDATRDRCQVLDVCVCACGIAADAALPCPALPSPLLYSIVVLRPGPSLYRLAWRGVPWYCT